MELPSALEMGLISGKAYRIGIVGAASLLGKELSDSLGESALAASDVVLLDAEDAAGQIGTAAGDISFIQKIEASSFEGLDFVFFADHPESTREYWQKARDANASIVDLTYALENEEGVRLRGPWADAADPVQSGSDPHQPDLTTAAVVSAHPAALMLLLVGRRLRSKFAVRTFAATVFEPASEAGQAAMDELHQQTVSLLSFQSLPREQYDAQVAFNMVASLGAAAKLDLGASRRRIAEQYRALASEGMPALSLQLIQAPVFHGYTASVLVELDGEASVGQVEAAIQGEHIDLVADESDPPSNLSAAGQPDVLVRVSAADEGRPKSVRFWLWLAGDNLKIAALNAVACANELKRQRPQGTVQ